MDKDLCYETMDQGDCLPLTWGYIHVYDHNIQTASSLKPCGQSGFVANQSQTLCEASLGRVNGR